MKHRRTHDQLMQTIQKTEEAIRTGKAKTVKEACRLNRIKPSQFYDKRKEAGTKPKMVNVHKELNKLKTNFEDQLVERVATKLIERMFKDQS